MKKLGPAPTPAPPPAGLSPARQSVLSLLRSVVEPVLVADAAAFLGLHPNTTREHLEALCAAGLASRARATPSGRGRPPWEYQATPTAPSPEVREYVGLVSALAEHVLNSSDRPTADALRAGRSWGAKLVTEQALPPRRRATRTLGLLDELGFSPSRPNRDGVVRLRTCPLLDVAQAYPDVVCAAHRGLVEGALSVLGRPPDDAEVVDLVPFAEPGACRLRIPLGGAGEVGPR